MIVDTMAAKLVSVIATAFILSISGDTSVKLNTGQAWEAAPAQKNQLSRQPQAVTNLSPWGNSAETSRAGDLHTTCLTNGLAANAENSVVASHQAATSTPADSFYMMCERDGKVGKPAESYACMSVKLKDQETACSGTGASQICENNYFSLCRKVGEAVGTPVDDQAGKGTFPDAESCMAKCRSEEEVMGKFGGVCLGDITPE